MYAFIYYIKDYCNSLYHGLPRSSLAHLQMVQNAAADLTSAKKKSDHISPILASVHWLF